MKNKHRLLLLLLSVLLLCLLSGCRLSHFERSEIVEWTKEEFDEKVVVSGQYEERTGEDGYVDRVWEAWLKSTPDLKFEIVSDCYYGMESVHHSINTTYYNVCGSHVFDLVRAECATGFVPDETQHAFSSYRVKLLYADRAEMEQAIADMETVDEAMKRYGAEDCIAYTLEYDDPLAEVDDTILSETFRTDSLSGAMQQLTDEFILYAADFRLALDQFTQEEIEDAVEHSDQKFLLTRADGTQISYPDLAVSRFGYGMSFGTLYEVLKREGFEPQGSPEDFSFVGIDGCEYAFSYRFNDYQHSVEHSPTGYRNGYYYLRDGEIIPMDYYFYNHMRTDKIKEMTGLSFERVYD